MKRANRISQLLLIAVSAMLLVPAVGSPAAKNKREPKSWFLWLTGHSWSVVAKLVNIQGQTDTAKTGKLMRCSLKTGAAVILWDPPGGVWSPMPIGNGRDNIAMLRPGGGPNSPDSGLWVYSMQARQGMLIIPSSRLPDGMSFDSLAGASLWSSDPLLVILKDSKAQPGGRYMVRSVDIEAKVLRMPESLSADDTVLDDSDRTMLIQAGRIRDDRDLQTEKPQGRFMHVQLRQKKNGDWPVYNKVRVEGYYGDFFDPAWLRDDEIVLVYSPL